MSFPTNRYTISEPRDKDIGEFHVAQNRRATDFEAQKNVKGLVGLVDDCSDSPFCNGDRIAIDPESS